LQYYRATVAYDGTDYLGFQLQASGRTVQGVLEAALLELTGTETRVVGSGRTDAGVHATGQVVGFRTPWRHTVADLHRALNAVLPPDVAVTGLLPADDGWHPRFSAQWRSYRYTVVNRPARDPLTRRYALHVAQPLRLDLLQAADQVIVGEHDFASFGRPMQEGETTVRAIFASAWQRHGELVTFDVTGNAFLRMMVRSLVGSMLQVGLGLWTVEQFAGVLAARDRSLAARPAAACGLCLMHVEYDTRHPNQVLEQTRFVGGTRSLKSENL
jgi:tRNA pseudouridine38-40 synthase